MKLKTLTAACISFSFDGLEDVVFDPTKASAACNEYARLMGFQARLRDTAALSRKQKDGTIVTITEEMRRNEVIALRDHLESGGEWEMRARAAIDPLVAQLAAKLGRPYAEVLAERQAKMRAEMQAMLDAE